MKKIVIIVFVLIWFDSTSQNRMLSIVPVFGVNSTRLNLNNSDYLSDFEKGGYYFVGGLETQLTFAVKKNKRFHWTLVSGVNYLANGFKGNSGFAIGALYYSYEKIDLKTKYVQVPLELKLKWRPFPLIEDFHLFAGAGLSGNKLLSAKLAEEGIYSILSNDIMNPPPNTSIYQDEEDVTNRGRNVTLFRRVEFGLEFQKFQIGFRFSKALQDMYFTGLENDWAVPVENSKYLSGWDTNGKILEKYSEVVIGFRIY
jgi:hypothetical protein